MTPRLLRGPTGSVWARHGPWATKRRARPRNGGATAARRAGGACIAPRATPIPTGRTARGKKCAPCPCPRRPGCLAGLRVSRPGSAPFASTPPPPLPILGPKMASAGGAWRAVARAGAGPRTWDSACGPRPMVPSGVRGGWPRPSTHARATPAPGGHRSVPRGPTRAVSGGYSSVNPSGSAGGRSTLEPWVPARPTLVPVFSPVLDGFPCIKRSPMGSRVFIGFPQVPL